MSAAWVLWVAAACLTGHVDSAWSWGFLVAVALVPPVVMLVEWNRGQTMSETIQKSSDEEQSPGGCAVR